MKKLLMITAIAAMASSAAYADGDDGSLVTYGTNRTGFSTIPFVSDHTYKRVMGRNFQSGPLHELGPKDKVEGRR